MSSLSSAQVRKVYQPLIVVFIGLVAFTIGGVIYAAWSTTVITLTPKLLPVAATFNVTISDQPTSADNLNGTVNSVNQTASMTVTPTGSGALVPAHASGSVLLTNHTAKTQPLASGTRLRSSSGVIVRTTSRVDVPAGGTATVTAVADPLGDSGNIEPGQLIIVALWTGLQNKIYGENSQAFTGGTTSSGQSLSQDELNTASNQAQDQIVKHLGSAKPGVFYKLEPQSVASQPEPDVPSASYQVTVTTKVTTVAYDAAALTNRATAELSHSLAEDQVLSNLSPVQLGYSDRPTANSIILSASIKGQAILSPTSIYRQAKTYLGLSADNIKIKALGTNAIKSVAVKFSPWWRTTAPDQAERITVIIAPPQA